MPWWQRRTNAYSHANHYPPGFGWLKVFSVLIFSLKRLWWLTSAPVMLGGAASASRGDPETWSGHGFLVQKVSQRNKNNMHVYNISKWLNQNHDKCLSTYTICALSDANIFLAPGMLARDIAQQPRAVNAWSALDLAKSGNHGLHKKLFRLYSPCSVTTGSTLGRICSIFEAVW